MATRSVRPLEFTNNRRITRTISSNCFCGSLLCPFECLDPRDAPCFPSFHPFSTFFNEAVAPFHRRCHLSLFLSLSICNIDLYPYRWLVAMPLWMDRPLPRLLLLLRPAMTTSMTWRPGLRLAWPHRRWNLLILSTLPTPRTHPSSPLRDGG